MPAGKRPGGPTQTKDARRATGRVRLDMWLPEAAALSLDAIATREGWTRARTVTEIVSEEYSPGVPGRACLTCCSGWPATEPDDEPWHHAAGCER